MLQSLTCCEAYWHTMETKHFCALTLNISLAKTTTTFLPTPRDTNPKPTAAQGVEEQAVAVNLERFMVPEVLFHPSDIGLQQAGLAECIQTSVSACHPALHALLYSNVLLVGGMAQCPGFRERLYDELRPLVPDCMELNISLPEAPVTCAWEGGSMLGASREYQKHALSKAQYEERGGGRR